MGEFDNFVTIEDDLDFVMQKQDQIAEKLFKFGIPFFDLSLGGIFSNDLILLGADSGVGKTELATNICHSAIKQKKKVLMFALEADRGEIAERILYKSLSNRFFADPQRHDVRIDYLKYYMRDKEVRQAFLKYWDEEKQKLAGDFNGLVLRYQTDGSFSIDQLEREISSQKDVDFIVVDHLHYFDLDGQNENAAIKATMKRIRVITQQRNVPILLLAQLRKPSDFGKKNTIVPSMHDFMGSSDLYKIATKVILLAPGGPSQNPAHRRDGYGQTVFDTYVNVAKFRADGSRTRFQAKTFFDISKNEYTPEFEVGFASSGTWTKLDEDQKPNWAKSHRYR